MASRLPEIQRSVIVNPAGVVPIRTAGAEILQQIGVVGQELQGFGAGLQQREEAKRAADAHLTGLRDGAARNPDGTLRPLKLRDNSTAANRAYNAAALSGYQAQYQTDQTAKASEIRLRHQNDPEGFKAEWAAWRQGQIANLPAEFQGEAAVLLDRLGSETYIGATEDKVSADLAGAKVSWQELLNAKKIDAGNLARQGGMSTPAYQRTLGEINGLYDQAVTSGWLTDTQAKLDREYLADEHQAQTIVSHAIAQAKLAGGGPAGRKAAEAELQQVLTDPELRIEPERRAQIVARFDTEMRSTDAEQELAVKEIQASTSALEDRLKAGGAVSPSEFMAQADQARAAGNPLLADALASRAALQSRVAAFSAMPYADQQRAIALKQQDLDALTAKAAKGSGSDAGTGDLFDAVVQVESGGNAAALSPKGAMGAAQIMAATGADPGFGVAPLKDASPEENLRFGRDYLNAMLTEFGGNRTLALAAYNAGPGAVDDWIARFGDPRSGQISDADFAASIPYPETRAYVGKVFDKLGGASAEANQAATELRLMRDVTEGAQAAFAADPFRVGTEKYKDRVGQVAPLDFMAADLPARLQGRLRQADFIGRMEGTYVPPMSATEIDGLAKIVAVATPDQKAALMKGLADGLGADHLGGVMSLLTEKGDQARLFSVAAGLAQDDPNVAADIFAGQELLDTGDKLYAPGFETKEAGAAIQSAIADATVLLPPEAVAGMRDAARALYALEAKKAGDFSGTLDAGRLQAAMDRITGGTIEYQDQAIFRPRSDIKTDADFADLIDGLTPADLPGLPVAADGTPISLDMIKTHARFYSVGDGVYQVVIPTNQGELSPLDAAGNPWTIDLRKVPLRRVAVPAGVSRGPQRQP